MAKNASNPDRLRREWLSKIEQIVQVQLNKLISTDRESTPEVPQLKITEIKALIELHTKLSDQKAGTSEFWEMIEKIRKAKLPDGEVEAACLDDEAPEQGEETN